MAPPRKKAVSRKRLLNLSNEVQPSAWQAKYQLLASQDPPHSLNGSGDGISSTTSFATSSGLVGDYDSDSEVEQSPTVDTSGKPSNAFGTAKLQLEDPSSSTSAQFEVPNTPWSQCFDQTSGYPYYWNQLTNEVSWQPPPQYIAALRLLQKKPPPVESSPKPSGSKNSTEKPKKKYPWEGSSDSEDEKIEMITTFGPQSEDESEEEQPVRQVPKKKKPVKLRPSSSGNAVIGPQLPNDSLSGSSHIIEEVHEAYETSSLIAPLVADVGPPGVEPQSNDSLDNDATSKRIKATLKVKSRNNSSDASDNEDILAKLKTKVKILEKMGGEVPTQIKELVDENGVTSQRGHPLLSVNQGATSSTSDIDKVPARTTKGLPTQAGPSKSSGEKPTSFALIASYGDDSDGEESPKKPIKEVPPLFPSTAKLAESKIRSSLNSVQAPDVKSRCLFPSASEAKSSNSSIVPEAKPASLFPSAREEEPLSVLHTIAQVSESKPHARLPFVAPQEEQSLQEPDECGNPQIDPYTPDSTTHKAFKRKKRIDVGVINYGASTSSACNSSDFGPVKEAKTCYNMDPSFGEHRGFGFSNLEPPQHAASKKSHAINFIKAGTMFNEPPKKTEEASTSKNREPLDAAEVKTIDDTANILKDKLSFLAEGQDAVSAIQEMAIQLETLLAAWHADALAPSYLTTWMSGTAADLAAKEQSAAPKGWTCAWDRDAKRYYYQSSASGAVVWDYPDPETSPRPDEESICNSHAIEEVEMELSDTPPRVSPTPPEAEPDEDPMPPSPPVISSRSCTPPAPPPPVISSDDEKARTKSNFNEVSSSCEGKAEVVVPLPQEEYPSPPPEPEEPPPPGVDDIEFATMALPAPHRTIPQKPPPDSSSQIRAKPTAHNFEVTTSVDTSSVDKALLSELDSFYSDIAMLDNATVSTSEEPPAPTISSSSSVHLRSSVTTSVASPSTYEAETEAMSLPSSSTATSSNGHEPPQKKRKRTKLTAGLTLQKKGVPSLVAKWQQVQEEARRKYDSDDSDDGKDSVSSTHK